MIDLGAGTPIVLIPGLQGRWEWMRPGVEALARRYRVVSFSLCDEPGSGFAYDPASEFQNFVGQVEAALDRARLDRAVLVGVSYGALIATEFAARQPDRALALVLASGLPIGWRPDRRARFYLRAPRLFGPLFFVTAPTRVNAEVAAALPALGERLRFVLRQTWQVASAPASPARMARRVHWALRHRFADPRQVQAPALVVTGERELDRVVPVDESRQWLEALRSAEHAVLARTGHLGIITRPDAFADLVETFVNGNRIPA